MLLSKGRAFFLSYQLQVMTRLGCLGRGRLLLRPPAAGHGSFLLTLPEPQKNKEREALTTCHLIARPHLAQGFSQQRLPQGHLHRI